MKYSKKGWEKRKKDREGLKEFFESCIGKIKKEKLCCKECGARLKGHVSEVAHILPKGRFRSIQTNELNWIPMCGQYSSSQCHTNFDTFSVKEFREMFVFSEISCIFTELEGLITEKISYKTYEKYERYQED